jgi:hypothetical protein
MSTLVLITIGLGALLVLATIVACIRSWSKPDKTAAHTTHDAGDTGWMSAGNDSHDSSDAGGGDGGGGGGD